MLITRVGCITNFFSNCSTLRYSDALVHFLFSRLTEKQRFALKLLVALIVSIAVIAVNILPPVLFFTILKKDPQSKLLLTFELISRMDRFSYFSFTTEHQYICLQKLNLHRSRDTVSNIHDNSSLSFRWECQ